MQGCRGGLAGERNDAIRFQSASVTLPHASCTNVFCSAIHCLIKQRGVNSSAASNSRRTHFCPIDCWGLPHKEKCEGLKMGCMGEVTTSLSSSLNRGVKYSQTGGPTCQIAPLGIGRLPDNVAISQISRKGTTSIHNNFADTVLAVLCRASLPLF